MTNTKDPIDAIGIAVSTFLKVPRQIKDLNEHESLHSVAAAFYALNAAVLKAERLVPKSQLRDALKQIRKLCGESPFISRMIHWPRGYPGDFETIECMVSGKNQAPRETFGWFLERISFYSPIIQQHRNKLSWQTDQIRETVLKKPDAKILSIACGSCLDFEPVRGLLSKASVTINDQDGDAVVAASERLGNSVSELESDTGNILRSIVRQKGKKFDLIIAGGLFDYLSDSAVEKLVARLLHLLSPDGRLCFTNICDDNPFRCWMEYCANWHLKGRSKTTLEKLSAHSKVEFKMDTTGLAFLVTMKNHR